MAVLRSALYKMPNGLPSAAHSRTLPTTLRSFARSGPAVVMDSFPIIRPFARFSPSRCSWAKVFVSTTHLLAGVQSGGMVMPANDLYSARVGRRNLPAPELELALFN